MTSIVDLVALVPSMAALIVFVVYSQRQSEQARAERESQQKLFSADLRSAVESNAKANAAIVLSHERANERLVSRFDEQNKILQRLTLAIDRIGTVRRSNGETKGGNG
jgi:uncharacterized protein YjiK